MPLLTFLIVLVVIVVVLAVTCVKIVPQAEAAIVERLGSYLTTWNNGLHIKVPFIDHVRMGISLKEQVFDFPPQPVITKDNVTISIDTVVFFKILDPKLFCYGVENPIVAIENLSATTIRNIIGELDLDTTLVSRDTINAKMRSILDEATDAWGIKVNRVEVKNITPPAAIQQAMEKQMKAEREKREAVLLAEGQKQSAITVAEGEKQAQILSAEAEKQAIILAAEAEKEKQIREAEGEAEAIRNVQRATAEGIAMVREAGADNAVLTLQAYEALKCVANGRATKLIIPSDIQGIAGLAASIKEIVTDDPNAPKQSTSGGQARACLPQCRKRNSRARSIGAPACQSNKGRVASGQYRYCPRPASSPGVRAVHAGRPQLEKARQADGASYVQQQRLRNRSSPGRRDEAPGRHRC